MKKIRVFVSIPMKDRNYEEIEKEMKRVILKLNDYELKNTKYELINSLLKLDKIKFSKECRNQSVDCLARSIKYLSTADIAFFCNGWKEARGCQIEHEIAKRYEIEIMEEQLKKNDTI